MALRETTQSSEDATPEEPVELSAREARGAGLGIENRKNGLRFAIAAGTALGAIILAAVITSVLA